MKRRKRGKQTLKRKMLSILLLCAMSCILAVVIVSYMTIRMIRNDSIPPRKMMGIDSCGMIISATHLVEGREGLNVLILDDHIPAGAKLY